MKQSQGESSVADPDGEGREGGLFWIFLKIGCQAFGGYMAIISMIERYLVEGEGRLSREWLLKSIAVANLLPGPIAVNVAVMAGNRCGGWRGFAAAWLGLLIPSVSSCLLLKWAFDVFGGNAIIDGVSFGLVVGVLAVIAASVVSFAMKSLEGSRGWSLFLGAFGIFALNPFGNRVITIGALYLASFLVCLWFRRSRLPKKVSKSGYGRFLKFLSLLGAAYALVFWALGAGVSPDNGSLDLLLNFSLSSLTLFGGAFSFISIVGELAVVEKAWVTMESFMEAVAIGQMSPGPVLVSSSCIGFEHSGLLGAMVATVGMFLPANLLALYVGRKIDRVSEESFVGELLKFLNPAVVGILAGAALLAVVGTLDFSRWTSGWGAAVLLLIGLFALVTKRCSGLTLLLASGLVYGLLGYGGA